MQPLVMVDGDYSASLDGLALAGDRLVEIKCPHLALRTAYDELSAKCDEAKAQLTALARHAKEQGGGVSVTRVWKRGVIDYKRIPELAGVDLERYRGPARHEVRVTTM